MPVVFNAQAGHRGTERALRRGRAVATLRIFPRSRAKATAPDSAAAVAEVIRALLDGTDAAVAAAFEQLNGLEAVDVIAELFLWVEDVTDGVDLDVLIAAARSPLPPNAKAIVEAVRARDLRAIEEATSKVDPNAVVSAVLGLIVSLKDARAQL